MSYHINRIRAPELLSIHGGLKVGTQILIRGKTPYGSSGFSVNLQYGCDDGCDNAFHFNPRTEGNIVVRNSFVGGDWLEEERDIPDFPFLEGRKFTIRILVTPDCYDVNVNGRDFITYSHRISYNDAVYLKLTKHAEFYDVVVQNSKNSPFNTILPSNRLREGVAVRIRGVVNPDAHQFQVHFNCDQDGDNVGFVFNPRQYSGEVFRNSRSDGDWQEAEQDTPDFPFQPGDFFDLLIIATVGSFNVYVNEKFFTIFNYRCSIEEMQYLHCGGDVSIADVDIYEPLPDSFVKEIDSGLEKSDLIIVKGFFYPEGNSFSINLLTGDTCDSGDIAFHFNPRRSEGEVVMNSRFDGDWEEEERHPNPPAFNEMLPFEVKIVVKSNKFKIYVNGKKFEKFRGRCAVDAIKAINVQGEAYIFDVQLLQRLDNPVVQKIAGNLQPGRWAFIHGTVKKNAERFEINLQCNDSLDYDDVTDIALHFNPRFSVKETVRNHSQEGSWGDEERDQPCFPFEPEDAFDIAINAQNDEFKVYVNGKHYIDFHHRLDVCRVSHIMLNGDANFFEPEFN